VAIVCANNTVRFGRSVWRPSLARVKKGEVLQVATQNRQLVDVAFETVIDPDNSSPQLKLQELDSAAIDPDFSRLSIEVSFLYILSFFPLSFPLSFSLYCSFLFSSDIRALSCNTAVSSIL
jgi:hypothetical protein